MAYALETTEKKFQKPYIHVGPAPICATEPLSSKQGGYFPLLPLINTNLLPSQQISSSALQILAHLSFVAFGG